jgi:hypothetical protein
MIGIIVAIPVVVSIFMTKGWMLVAIFILTGIVI